MLAKPVALEILRSRVRRFFLHCILLNNDIIIFQIKVDINFKVFTVVTINITAICNSTHV